MAEVRMPKMGDSMEEGTILRWIKQEGETVKVEEPIAEIETDKANVEIQADEAGRLTKIVAAEGQTVPVGAVIAIIGDAAATAAPSPNGGGKETARAAAPEAIPSADPSAIGEAGSAPASAFSAAPPPPLGQGARAAEEPSAERIKASPLARRMAREMGIDLAQVRGSGPGGRIVERDISAFQQEHGAAPRPREAATAAPGQAGRDVEISRMRRTIARRTVQSKQTVPHFYITMPVEMDRAMDLLAQMNAQNPEQKVTVNDLIVKACAVALERFPDVNVSYTPDEKIRHYDTINISIAVPTGNGLTMPVVTDCGRRTLRQIAAETKGLIGRARGGSLTPQEMSGGTFSVSNMGMLGVEEFAAIINPPESAILAVGAVAPEVMVDESGGFAARRRMRVTLSCDHRTVDGALGAQFLQEVKRQLESPLNLLS